MTGQVSAEVTLSIPAMRAFLIAEEERLVVTNAGSDRQRRIEVVPRDHGTSIHLPLLQLDRRHLDKVVSVVFEHYGSIEKVEKSFRDGLSLRLADVTMTCSFSERSFERSGFSFFAKAFTQAQLETVVSVWKQFVHRLHEGDEEPRSEVDDGDDGDPLVELEELGAIVYPPDRDWTFERLAGATRTKREAEQTIVLPLVRPDVFAGVTALTRVRPTTSLPRAVLFEGAPGTGKTTMARIVASMSDRSLVYVPVEAIASKWYGESEERLAEIFDLAGRVAGAILFLDEIDSLVGSREEGMHEVTRRILSVLLRSLQGLDSASSPLLIGATNLADHLDPALKSRFNRVLRFELPDEKDRAAILATYAKHLAPDELRLLARSSEGRSGRDLEDICGDAERCWATRLIAEQRAVEAPPLTEYLDALGSKGAQQRDGLSRA